MKMNSMDITIHVLYTDILIFTVMIKIINVIIIIFIIIITITVAFVHVSGMPVLGGWNGSKDFPLISMGKIRS